MAELHEIIHDLTYNVNAAPLQKALEALQGQVNTINVLQNSLQKLQAQYAATSDPVKQKQLAAAITNTQRAIDAQTKALQQNIATNKQLQDAVNKEIGLVGNLSNKLQRLKRDREVATSPDDIRRLNREITQANNEIRKLTDSKTSVLGNLAQGFRQGVGIGLGLGTVNLVANGINQIREFVAESIRLAEEAEGVTNAFNRLNDPQLLTNLRQATRGTVSDLELMRNAVQFNNFGLPVERLADALQFARVRARETGEDVDYLVKSITIGIGRQSPLILDNLGINARRVREEFQKTGNFAEAAFKIIQEEGAKANTEIGYLADNNDRLNASLQNSQAQVGSFFARYKAQYTALFADIIGGLSGGPTDNLDQVQGALIDQADVERQAKMQQDIIRQLEQFATEYESVDADSRMDVINMAQRYQKQMVADAREFYKDDFHGFTMYRHAMVEAYQDLYRKFAEIRELGKPPLGIPDQNVTQLEETIKRNKELIDSYTQDQLRDPAQKTARDKLLEENKAAQKAIDEIQGKRDKVADKAIKTAESLAERRHRLELDLQRKIIDLAESGEQLRLKGTVESSEKIKAEIDARTRKLIEETNIQEREAIRQGLITQKLRDQFRQIRNLIGANADQDFYNRNQDFLKKQADELQGFYIDAAKNRLAILQGRADLSPVQNREELAEQLALEREIALEENDKKYRELYAQREQWGQDTKDLDKQYQDDVLLIQEQANRRALDAEARYLEQLQDQLNRAGGYLIALSQSEADDELDALGDLFDQGAISYRNYLKRLKKIQLEEGLKENRLRQGTVSQQLDNAVNADNQLKTNPNATTSDLQASFQRIVELRNELERLKQEERATGREFIELRQQEISVVISLYEGMARTIASSLNQIYEAQQQSLTREIAIREERKAVIAPRGGGKTLKQMLPRLAA